VPGKLNHVEVANIFEINLYIPGKKSAFGEVFFWRTGRHFTHKNHKRKIQVYKKEQNTLPEPCGELFFWFVCIY